MRYLILFIACLSVINIYSQSYIQNSGISSVTEKYCIQYDSRILRVSNATFPIGIVRISTNGDTIKTRGFLKGKDRWSKYKLEIEGGSFCFGKLNINQSDVYRENDSLSVRVYTRKWLLGKKNKYLFTQKIAFNYETDIELLTPNDIKKAPGNHIPYVIRTYFNNGMYIDKASSVTRYNLQDFILISKGGYIDGAKDKFWIYEDPLLIQNHKVKLAASLKKHQKISDTLEINLDYIDDYICRIKSKNNGHDLNVDVDLYSDSLFQNELLFVQVTDIVIMKKYNYLVNVNGGSITISSCGADGSKGSDGSDGSDGLDGIDGLIHTEITTECDSSGCVTFTETLQDPGSDGSDGYDGEDGTDGGNGNNGGSILLRYSIMAEKYLDLITALSIPGSGGSGGDGGSGGKGGRGGNGDPSGTDGNDGMDGRDGSDGSCGNKGEIVYVCLKFE